MDKFSTFLLIVCAAALGLFLRANGYGEVLTVIDIILAVVFEGLLVLGGAILAVIAVACWAAYSRE